VSLGLRYLKRRREKPEMIKLDTKILPYEPSSGKIAIVGKKGMKNAVVPSSPHRGGKEGEV